MTKREDTTMPQSESSFRKRVYTLSAFGADLAYLISHPHYAFVPRFRISKAFQERIMLAVTSVNECRYCSWFHKKMAHRAQIPGEQIRALLQNSAADSIPEKELPAIYYAFAYAESERVPDTEIEQRARAAYGEGFGGVYYTIRMIYFGNLCGNTFDAFLSRLRGHSVDYSSLATEIVVSLVSAPFLLPLVPILSNSPKG
jgi:AhpD family alkylhydroperoxidase